MIKNPKRRKEYWAKYRQEHRERIREYNRKWAQKQGKEWHTKKAQQYRNTLKGYYSRLVATRKNKEVGVFFSFEEFERWEKSQKQECHYCGISKETIVELGMPWRYKTQVRFSLDRLDSSKGYSLDNICLCCRVCNEVKNNILTTEEMKEIGQKYIKPKWQKKK